MIQAKTIDGVLLRDMVVAGAALLEKHREAVDALNVFPVPDGDTGTNMSLTMASATREVNQKEYLNAGEAAAAVSKGALKGARGNSGVITSQLLRGFSRALAGVERITPAQFAAALKSGAETAYKAVMKPKEGTILTVARVIAEEAVKQAERTPDDYDALFTNILSTGEVILKKYSPIGEMSAFAKDYTESIFRAMGHIACIVDRDQVVAASGVSKKELSDKPISPDLETAIANRQTVAINRAGGGKIVAVTNEEDINGYTAQVVSPIIADGEAIGAVLLLSKEQGARMGDAEMKVAETAAGIVGRQMEQ